MRLCLRLRFTASTIPACRLGAVQVSCRADLANWTIPGKMVKGMGGAMDLVAGAAHVIVAMEHNAKDGEFKIVRDCSLPLTGRAVVHDMVTELGWFHVAPEGLVVKEIVEGITKEEIEQRTGCPVQFAADLRPMPASRDGEQAQSSTQPDVRSLACPR